MHQYQVRARHSTGQGHLKQKVSVALFVAVARNMGHLFAVVNLNFMHLNHSRLFWESWDMLLNHLDVGLGVPVMLQNTGLL